MVTKRKSSDGELMVLPQPPRSSPDSFEVIDVPPPPIRTKRGCGWRRDPHDPRDLTTRSLFGARRGLPMEATLEQHVEKVLDQKSLSCCVGEAVARAIHVRCAHAGTPIAYPSVLGIYNVARALGRLAASEALVDDGSQPRLAMKGIREWGVPPEALWPFDEAAVNRELPLDVLERASAFKLAAWHRIDALGKGRVEDVCQAISQGYPVVCGVDVDQAFFDYAGGKPATAPVGSEGGHMLCLLGYRTVGGQRQLRGINSWGNTWGDRGLFWADEAWATAPGAGDFYVLTVVGG